MKPTAIGIALIALAGVAGLHALGAPFTILQKADSTMPGYQVIAGFADFQPGATTGRHSHPGEVVGHVVGGSLLVEQDGKPAMTVTDGQAFIIPAGVVHNNTNTGRSTVRMLTTYVIPKGKDIRVNPPK